MLDPAQPATYQRFAALCAVNSIIGSKRYAIVTKPRIRAGMLGYASGNLLFDDAGQHTDAGRALIRLRRNDGLCSEWLESKC